MRGNKRFDVAVVLLFVIITFVLWALMMPLSYRFGDYGISTHSLGQITGLIGTTLFALTFVLTTKLKIVESSSKGLDKTYTLHHKLGALAFVLLLFHPLLLVIKFIPSNWAQAAIFLLPSGSWAVNFGIIALGLMIVLLILTFYVTMKYQNWKFSHKLLGFAFIIACLHVLLISSDVSRSVILRAWMIFILVIGVVSYVYGSYLIHVLKKKYKYVISKVEKKDSFTVLTMSPKDGIENNIMNFKAGQFMFIKFDIAGFKEIHPFTIACKPGGQIRLVIKNLGDYTANINKLKVGTTAIIDGPYGRFDFASQDKDQVWIAGGVGVTPFLSFAESLAESDFKKKIDLYYCTKDESEQIYLDDIKNVEQNSKKFRVIPFVQSKSGYINADIIDKTSGLKNKAIFLCGPPSMMKILKSQFISKGIKEKNIFMEDFGFK
jgi:predicted ferric reductase